MIPLAKYLHPLELPQVTLQGPRVMLRPPRLEDWPQWATVRANNRDRLRPFEPLWAEDCLTEDYFRRKLARQITDWREDHAYPFLIFRNGKLIGGINLNHLCRGAAQHAMVGYWIDKEHEDKGFMRESMELIMRHAFVDLDLRRLNAAILPKNQRSRVLLERLRFKEEGFAKAYLQIEGWWQDHILFGLVRRI